MNKLQKLNLEFLHALNEIFKVNKCSDWSELSKNVTIDRITESFRLFATIFSRRLNRFELMSDVPAKNKLISVFHGTLDGQTIINNIARFSIYTDQIIVFHPLQNPNFTHPDFSPITNAAKWRTEFVHCLYFYLIIQKWVEAGIVNLIESPFENDPHAKQSFIDAAKERMKDFDEGITESELKKSAALMEAKLSDSILFGPVDSIQALIKNKFPQLNDKQTLKLAQEFKANIRTIPLNPDFSNIREGQIIATRTGANVEEVAAICKLVGGHSYCTEPSIKKQLQKMGTAEFWTKFGILYSGLSLTFLNNVDTAFALKIREEQRLEGFRSALRSLSQFIDTAQDSQITESIGLQFNDLFKSEIEKTEEEWKSIVTESTRNTTTAFLGAEALQLLKDPTQIIIPAVGVPIAILIDQIFTHRKLKSYRSKMPFSVFVDLKNKDVNFFTKLKNALFN